MATDSHVLVAWTCMHTNTHSRGRLFQRTVSVRASHLTSSAHFAAAEWRHRKPQSCCWCCCLNSSAQFELTIPTPATRVLIIQTCCSRESQLLRSFVEVADLLHNITVCVCGVHGVHELVISFLALLTRSLSKVYILARETHFRPWTSRPVLTQRQPEILISTLLCSSEEAEGFFNLFLSSQRIQTSSIQFLSWRMTKSLWGFPSPPAKHPPRC